jgi:hypothetical protein
MFSLPSVDICIDFFWGQDPLLSLRIEGSSFSVLLVLYVLSAVNMQPYPRWLFNADAEARMGNSRWSHQYSCHILILALQAKIFNPHKITGFLSNVPETMYLSREWSAIGELKFP